MFHAIDLNECFNATYTDKCDAGQGAAAGT